MSDAAPLLKPGTDLVDRLRSTADIAEAGGKPHWAKLMRDAVAALNAAGQVSAQAPGRDGIGESHPEPVPAAPGTLEKYKSTINEAGESYEGQIEDEEERVMAMLPNDYHPGPRCSCRECLRAYPVPQEAPSAYIYHWAGSQPDDLMWPDQLSEAMKRNAKPLYLRERYVDSRDAERFAWLCSPDRHVLRRDCDLVRSDPCLEKSVTFYIHGKYTEVEGKDLREAVDEAMRVYRQSSQPGSNT